MTLTEGEAKQLVLLMAAGSSQAAAMKQAEAIGYMRSLCCLEPDGKYSVDREVQGAHVNGFHQGKRLLAKAASPNHQPEETRR